MGTLWHQVWPNLAANLLWVPLVGAHHWLIRRHLLKIHRHLAKVDDARSEEMIPLMTAPDDDSTPNHRRLIESNYALHRLGRHLSHDSRSINYAEPVLPKGAISSVNWTRRIPILDQGQLGSCTGNAATGLLGTDNANGEGLTQVVISAEGAASSHGVFEAGVYQLNEDFAVKLYSLATILDSFSGQYPPTDTGSSGLGVAKALVALGLASKYTHAFSVAATKSALQRGPVIIGTVWLNSMFNTDKDGHIQVDPKSGQAGGHELELCRYDLERGWFWFPNSWNLDWGLEGWGYVTEAEFTWMMSQQGDVTVPNLNTGPAPAPVPLAGVTAAQVADAVRSTLTNLGV